MTAPAQRRRSGRAPAPAALLAVLLLGPMLVASAAPAATHAPVSEFAILGTHDDAEAVAARTLLADVQRRLPPRWREALGEVTVVWRDDLPAEVHGRRQGRRVLLPRRLLQDWRARPADAGDGHPAVRAALAAIVHELAHVYDRGAGNVLSRDPRLLDLAGWQVRPLRLGTRGDNAFRDRSPDRYELHSPAEFVAVNLEYFVLDGDYACRRPALHRYFAAHFSSANIPATATCPTDQVFVQADAEAPLLRLDAARIYEVDYLLAEGNHRVMSRWGHSMLRLVICAPGRAPGPDCRLDLQHHRVLSFRAFVDDVQISSWRGLTGAYPSRLFVLPLDQVIEEYAKVELRGLRSIPLRLTRREIALLLERAARLHWSYDGRYAFVGNNCAVETFKLLHDGVPRLAAARLSSITPYGLLRRLQRAGIADARVLDDRAQAQRLGYYFAPASAHYQAMFEVARQALPLPQRHVQAWLALPPEARAPWLAQADLRAGAALLLLEQAALRRQQLLARDALKRRLLRSGDAPLPGAETETLMLLRETLRLQGLSSRPALLLADGYGLPQDDERQRLQRIGGAQAADLTVQDRRLREAARRLLPPRHDAALRAIDANLDTLGSRLRQLHGAAGAS